MDVQPEIVKQEGLLFPCHDSLLSSAVVTHAQEQHLLGIKQLVDRYRQELGFVNKAILTKSMATRSLLVASSTEELNSTEQQEIKVVGLLHFYIRRDEYVSLYSIAVAEEYRGHGIGQLLFTALIEECKFLGKSFIRLKCPIDLPANAFYRHIGMKLDDVEQGKKRPLNVWSYPV